MHSRNAPLGGAGRVRLSIAVDQVISLEVTASEKEFSGSIYSIAYLFTQARRLLLAKNRAVCF